MIRFILSSYRFLCNIIDTPAAILLYHRVTNLSSDPQQLAVSPENFDDQITFLKKKYALINLEEFCEGIIKEKKLPKRAVVITFDDGYADNLHEALPILEANSAQAIFYISTSLLDTKYEFWWDEMERIFLSDERIPGLLTLDVNGKPYSFGTSSKEERVRTYHAMLPVIKNCNTQRRNDLMKKIINWSCLRPEGRASHRLLTSEELITLSKSKSSIIGAHTHGHPKLSICSYHEQFEEIRESKNKIEKLLNTTVEHFSYPFGTKEDYNAESIQVCQELGFKIVCANYHDQLHRWHNRYELPRILIRNWSMKEFQERMSSFFRF
jgi:peptidoglycan/xylan/chitin deacetylase (PgdA/CDA1 family)